MKKFLSLFLIALVLCSAFVFPVSANNASGYFLSGTWYFNDTLTIPSPIIQYEVHFSYVGPHSPDVDGIRYMSTIYYGPALDGDDYYELLYYNENGGKYETYYYSDLGWGSDESARTITFNENGVYVNEHFYTWFTANATKIITECDGSSCPATDLNNDNICDDCGLPFVYNLRNDVKDYYGVMLPVVPDLFNGKDTYYTLYENGTDAYTLVASDTYFEVYGSNVVINGKANIIYLAAEVGQTSWSQFSSQNATWDHFAVRPFDQLIWSSHDVYNMDTKTVVFEGESNFHIPLWTIPEGAIMEMSTKTKQTMALLTSCGVGLMALLISLILLKKKSLLFLGK